ncbi:MAG: hypothetical protein R3211_01560 [Balneolaceae bacterium]|nr:hypothetical protein [Balneolaceae bacterium]
MIYPIFNSVVNRIESELNERDIKIKTFKTWDEDRINATGLEIVIDLSDNAHYLKALSINFDWDRFRETVLARKLEGMEEHPFLQEENVVDTNIAPLIDIEVSWLFDEQKSQPAAPVENGNERLEAASKWMEAISKEVNEYLSEDDIITRWHIEVEGDEYGKYLAAINLISYFQYSLSDLRSLNEVHRFIHDKLEELLKKSRKIIKIADNNVEKAAA